MLWNIVATLLYILQGSTFTVSVFGFNIGSKSNSDHSASSSLSSSLSSSSSSSYNSKQHSSYSSGVDFPLGYRYKYASDFDSYVSYPLHIDSDLDTDFHDVDLDYDVDLDLDFDDIDLDLDLLKLKYGLYGLNHYSLRNPHFNDYRFRRRYRLRRRPYFRPHHRYFPAYWKHDLDFWGLDNYGLGFDYDKYLYTSSLSFPTSYIHISSF